MTLEHAFDALLSACLGGVAWFVARLSGKMDKISDELPKVYATKEEVLRIEDKVTKGLETLGDKIESGFERIYDKLDTKQDK